jgi:hypothetical protein
MGSDGLRRRVDRELVRRGLVASREEAQRVIDARRVQVDGAPVRKASTLVLPSQQLRVGGPPPRFVSRGGEKLQGAVDRFSLDLDRSDRPRCGDLHRWLQRLRPPGWSGAGGRRGRRVRAARGTAASRPAGRPCTSAPTSDPSNPARSRVPADVLVADLSFISLTTVLPGAPAARPVRRPRGRAREAPVRGRSRDVSGAAGSCVTRTTGGPRSMRVAEVAAGARVAVSTTSCRHRSPGRRATSSSWRCCACSLIPSPVVGGLDRSKAIGTVRPLIGSRHPSEVGSGTVQQLE